MSEIEALRAELEAVKAARQQDRELADRLLNLAKAEIERLRQVEVAYVGDNSRLLTSNSELRAENDRLIEANDALRAELVRMQAQRQVDNEHFVEQLGQQGAEIAKMQRHHDLFCRCDSIRYGYA